MGASIGNAAWAWVRDATNGTIGGLSAGWRTAGRVRAVLDVSASFLWWPWPAARHP